MAFFNPSVSAAVNSNKNVQSQVSDSFDKQQTLNSAFVKLTQGKITHNHPDAKALGTHSLQYDKYKQYRAPSVASKQENFESYDNNIANIAMSSEDLRQFIKHDSTQWFASYPFQPAFPLDRFGGPANPNYPASLPQDKESLPPSLSTQGRTLNTPPVPLPPGHIPGPSYNAGLYTGPVCEGPQCNGPIKPTQSNYYYVSVSSSPQLSGQDQEHVRLQKPFTLRPGNSTDMDNPVMTKYAGPYNIVFLQ
jgi:hypothetical protein